LRRATPVCKVCLDKDRDEYRIKRKGKTVDVACGKQIKKYEFQVTLDKCNMKKWLKLNKCYKPKFVRCYNVLDLKNPCKLKAVCPKSCPKKCKRARSEESTRSEEEEESPRKRSCGCRNKKSKKCQKKGCNPYDRTCESGLNWCKHGSWATNMAAGQDDNTFDSPEQAATTMFGASDADEFGTGDSDF